MSVLLNQISSFSAFLVSISFVFYLFLKYVKKKDNSKNYFILMFLGTSIFYLFTFIRSFFANFFILDNFLWVISLIGFNFFISILITIIIDLKLKIKPFIFPFIYFLLFLILLFTNPSQRLETQNGVLWISNYLINFLLWFGLIILVLLSILFYNFGFKNKKILIFSVGLLLSSSIILEIIPLINYFLLLRVISVISLSLMFYSLLIQK